MKKTNSAELIKSEPPISQQIASQAAISRPQEIYYSNPIESQRGLIDKREEPPEAIQNIAKQQKPNPDVKNQRVIDKDLEN